jgi:hypothetical protein
MGFSISRKLVAFLPKQSQTGIGDSIDLSWGYPPPFRQFLEHNDRIINEKYFHINHFQKWTVTVLAKGC